MANDGKFILDGKRVKFSEYGGSSMADREQHTMWQELDGTITFDELHPGKQDQVRQMTDEIRANMELLLEIGLPEPYNGWNFNGDILEVVAKAYRIGQHDTRCYIADRLIALTDEIADEITGEL